jgi:hypothetical protein
MALLSSVVYLTLPSAHFLSARRVLDVLQNLERFSIELLVRLIAGVNVRFSATEIHIRSEA